MKIEKINQPSYRITVTAEEITDLWRLMFYLNGEGRNRDYHGIIYQWYNKLEDVRPGGGFDQ